MSDIVRFLEDNGVKGILQKGNEIAFCCPFHDDSTPSCSLNVKHRVFHCFGCGAKGSLALLVSKLKGVDVSTILKEQKEFSLESLKDKDIVQEVQRILRGIEEVPKKAALDEKVLEQFKFMHAGIRERVGDVDILRKFEVGYSKKDKRVTLPVRDEYGRLVAVMGRATKDENPKYKVLLPQKGFEKSKYLYGLHLFKEKKNLWLVLCEGHFDVINFYKCAFPYAVGVMGSFLSDEQKNSVLKYTDEVIIAMDNDEPGKQATKQIINKLRGLVTIRLFKYPVNKKDPGELTQEELYQGIGLSEKVI